MCIRDSTEPMLTKELTSKTMSFAKGANYVGETW